MKTKIFTEDEIEERNELSNILTYDISNSSDVIEDECKMYITFYAEDGCVLDHDPITYLFQNELPEDFYNEYDGYYSYNGDLSIKEIDDILSKLFKN